MTARKSPKKKPASKSRSKTSRPGKKAGGKKAAGKATAGKQAPARKPEQATAEREGVVYSDLRHQFRSRLLDRLL